MILRVHRALAAHRAAARSDRVTPGDEGIILVVAVLTAVVALSLVIVTTMAVMKASRDSGVNRQRAVAGSAAEAGIDGAYAAITAATPTTLPCRYPQAAGTTLHAQGSDDAQVVATISYYDANGNALACTGAALPATASPTKAVIRSQATTTALSGGTTRGVRTMEAAMSLRADLDGGIEDAVYANGKLTFALGPRMLGFTGNDADIYSNDSIVCANGDPNSVFDGSLYAQKEVRLEAPCRVKGDLRAGTNVRMTHSGAAVAGYVSSTNGSFYGVAESGGNVMVGKTVQVKIPTPPQTQNSQADWDGCWTSSNRLTLQTPARCQWLSSVPPPPSKPFPQVRGDSAALATWVAAGYTVIRDTDAGMDPTCSKPDVSGLNWISDWIKTHAATLTTKTVLSVQCPGKTIRFQNMGGTPIAFSQDFALFARSGLITSGPTIFGSTNAAARTVQIIVPYDATATPGTCTASDPTITLDNQTDIQPTLRTLVYTPCKLTMSDVSTFYGQVYAGTTLDINNAFTQQFTRITMPAGSIATETVAKYDLDTLYKRDVPNS